MALTNIKVAQQACLEVGLNPVDTMTDTTTEGQVIAAHYDTVVGDALANHYWRFACGQAVLNLLTDTPAGRWPYAFQLPPEVLAIRAVTVNDSPIEFERYDDKIYCDADATIDVVLDGIYDTVESKWEPYFTRHIVLKLAAILASGVREDADMSKLKEELAEIQWRKAKNTDSKGRTTSRLRPTRITNARLRRAGIGRGSANNG
jgi:hypothetical protein